MGQHRRYNNKHGGALLFAIITAFILTLVVSTIVILTTNQYRIVDSEIDRIRAFYLNQAGMEWAIYNLYSGTPGWIPAGGDGSSTTHTLTLTLDGNLKTITINVYDLPTAPPQPVFQNISNLGIQISTGY